MNVLMYPLGPDENFPDECCAIRQGSGEHTFYTPVGESASLMLFRAESENAKLRELVKDYERCSVHADCGLCEYDGKLSTHCPLSPCFPDADDLRDLGVEVNDG